MIDWGRPFGASYHPARAYLLLKGVYLLLAFDAWLTMLPHGARYGVGDFNVTHFAWLDALCPVPSAELYGGVMSSVGLLALLHVLIGGARFLRVAVAVLFTSSWLVSLLDSYQHHYLLSWILLWTCFMPDVPADSAPRRDVAHVRGWGVPMTAVTCGIVYAFTALAKSEADWRAGHVLIRLSKSKAPGHPDPGVLDPLRDLLMSLAGINQQTAWAWIAHSVVALQVVTAIGYFAASQRDARPGRRRSILCGLALFTAFSFHAFAELGGMFDIGWFSYYMIWIAFALLSPAAWVAWLARAFAWPGQALLRSIAEHGNGPATPSVLAQLLGAAALFCALGSLVDLPGVLFASVSIALLVLVWGGLQVQSSWTTSAQWLAIASTLTAAIFYGALTSGEARFDYYRRGAGELRAIGELEQALHMYQKAQRYAEPGKSRKKQIQELKQMIQATRGDSD